MVKSLQEKVENIAEKYANLVEKLIDGTEGDETIYQNKMDEINEGIRMLNHIAGTLYKLETCSKTNQKVSESV